MQRLVKPPGLTLVVGHVLDPVAASQVLDEGGPCRQGWPLLRLPSMSRRLRVRGRVGVIHARPLNRSSLRRPIGSFGRFMPKSYRFFGMRRWRCSRAAKVAGCRLCGPSTRMPTRRRRGRAAALGSSPVGHPAKLEDAVRVVLDYLNLRVGRRFKANGDDSSHRDVTLLEGRVAAVLE